MMKTLKVLGIDKAVKIVLSIVLAVSIITPLQHVYATTDGEEPVATETTGTETTEVQNTADTQKVDEEQQVNNPTETEVTYEIQNTEAPVTSEVPENTEVPAPTGTTEPTETPVSTEAPVVTETPAPAETPTSTEVTEPTETEGNSNQVLEPEVTDESEDELVYEVLSSVEYSEDMTSATLTVTLDTEDVSLWLDIDPETLDLDNLSIVDVNDEMTSYTFETTVNGEYNFDLRVVQVDEEGMYGVSSVCGVVPRLCPLLVQQPFLHLLHIRSVIRHYGVDRLYRCHDGRDAVVTPGVCGTRRVEISSCLFGAYAVLQH